MNKKSSLQYYYSSNTSVGEKYFVSTLQQKLMVKFPTGTMPHNLDNLHKFL
jgi:hypothetical protein